jgi:serine/threonine protein kinase
MELCSFTLRHAINIVKNNCKTDNNLSLIGYYISSELMKEILECVQYLHSQKNPIIHRDLKPANILINFSNNTFIKISDFGLSTYHEYSYQTHTKYMGTEGFKAPELRDPKKTKKYTTKVDIFSLGVIIKELFDINKRYEIVLI